MALVWAFHQEQATFVRYQPGTTDPTGGKWGICISLTLLWIQKTLLNGGPLPNDQEITRNVHLAAIRQGSMQMNWKIIRRTGQQGFDPDLNMYVTYSLRRGQGGTGLLWSFADPFEEMCVNGPGYYAMTMKIPGVGHAVGFRIDPNGMCYFFDPNFGLFSYADLDEMHLAMFALDSTFPQYLGGRYWWRHVTLA